MYLVAAAFDHYSCLNVLLTCVVVKLPVIIANDKRRRKVIQGQVFVPSKLHTSAFDSNLSEYHTQTPTRTWSAHLCSGSEPQSHLEMSLRYSYLELKLETSA